MRAVSKDGGSITRAAPPSAAQFGDHGMPLRRAHLSIALQAVNTVLLAVILAFLAVLVRDRPALRRDQFTSSDASARALLVSGEVGVSGEVQVSNEVRVKNPERYPATLFSRTEPLDVRVVP
jgi:hypothetical protein